MAKLQVNVLNGVSDAPLASFRKVSNERHLEHLEKHIRRKGKKYAGVHYYIDVLKDSKSSSRAVSKIRHFVIDMGFESTAKSDGELAHDMAMRRVILKAAYLHVVERNLADKVRLAAIVGDENVNPAGETYQMHDALHVMFEGFTDEAMIQAMVDAFHGYLDYHGYVMV